MKKLTLILTFTLIYSIIYSQEDILLFKKKYRSIEKFWKGSIISFQDNFKQWHKGEITRIHNDSFYIRPSVVNYGLMGTDTVYFRIQGYKITDIYAMPKKGFLISYKDGSYQFSKTGGHVHWYWIKNGLLFRLLGGGCVVLSIANGTAFGIAAGGAVLAIGVLMGKMYKPYIKVEKKYRVESFRLDNQSTFH